MSSDSPVIESYSAFSLSSPTTTYQVMPTAATHQVETSGVRYVAEIEANRRGSAPRRAMDSPVREAGMIVVWVEATAELATAISTTQSQPPSVCEDSSANTASSWSAFSASQPVPAKETTAMATPR